MELQRRSVLIGSLAAATPALAQCGALPSWPPRERFPLWPGPPPGAPEARIAPNWSMNGPEERRELWIRGVPGPEVNVFRPGRPDGSALLVLPGGGYGFLSVQNEGLDPAQRFSKEGTTVFVLTYRLPIDGWSNRHLVPLQDAQRAMRLIRSRAGEYRIDPRRLGVLGFSAGGHLAADLATSPDERTYAPVDAADQISARPAFLGLVYPVISLDTTISRGSSAPNLLGPDASPELVASRSPAPRVNGNTPASFVCSAFNDDLVLIDNSLMWIDACRRAKVPVEAHLLAEGGHGYGLHQPEDKPGSRWPELFMLWMRNQVRADG